MLRVLAVRVVPVLLGLAASALALRFAYPPYLWIAAIWAAVAALAFLTSSGRGRVVWFNLGAVVVALGAGEFYCWSTTPAGALRTTSEPGFVTSHEFLGNAPYPGVTSIVSRTDGDSLIFRVTYTIDSSGWRATPPPPAGKGPPIVAFFGCSLTFGEGVADSATLPAQVGRVSGGRLRGLNFGFSGYGPHQMLAILQHRLEAPSLTRPPVAAVYQAIPSHVYRALGRTTWDAGPRYEPEPGGGVRYAGRFLSPQAVLRLNLLYRSFLLRRVIDGWNQRLSRDDYDRFFRIVAEARRVFEDRYPGAAFVVLYWDTRQVDPASLEMDRVLLEGFGRHGLRVVTASDALPGYPDAARRYLLSEHDAHPNALAYRLLARHLVDRVLTPAAGDDSAGATAEAPRTE